MSSYQTSKALSFRTLNGPLQVVERDVNSIRKDNHILVRVHAASINPVDAQIWHSPLVGVVTGEKGLGRDFSGTIVEVGSKVKGNWAAGDDVFGLHFEIFGQGSFSQYISIDPASDPVVKKPSSLTHEAAAAIPLVALTAFACLDWLPMPTGSQRRVVVRGASGGTGSWIVQLAKLLYDCHVTAICSGKNADYVKGLGADEVIDYSSQPVLQTLNDQKALVKKDYDLIVDCVGGTELIPSYAQLLHTSGAYITIVGDKSDVKSLGGPVTYLTTPAQIIRYIKGYIWGPRYACVSFYTKSSLLQQVVGLAERGELKIEIQEVIKDALNEENEGWKKALELMESKRVRGKIVLEIL